MNRKPRAKGKKSARIPGKKRATTTLSLMVLFPEYRKFSYKKRVEQERGEHLKELRDAYLHVGLALYVGAGVSRSMGLPNWAELIRSLTVAMMTRKVQTAFQALGKYNDEKYWRALNNIQEDVEKSADYDRPMLMMARAIKDELGADLPRVIMFTLLRHIKRSQALLQYVEAQRHLMREYDPGVGQSDLLKSLVALARAERDTRGIQAIVNYNYDDLLDVALRGSNVRCLTVRSGKDKVPQGSLPCYHVHGVLPVGRAYAKNQPLAEGDYGNFVFSEDEYHVEYSDPYRWSNMTQISLLGKYIGLFVGLSLEDPNLRRLIDVTHRQYPETHNYAILARKHPLKQSRDDKACVMRNLFEQVEAASFENIGMHIIWVDSVDEIPGVIRAICEGEKTAARALKPLLRVPVTHTLSRSN